MSDLMNWFIPEQFMPHGHCYLWDPFLLRQNVVSNALVGLSYYCIPLALIYFVKKRKDVQFDWIFLMFSGFIFACGTTHLMEIFTIWHPAYRLQASLVSLTALASVATLIMLIRLMPQLLKIPSPKMLQGTISELEREVGLRIAAEKSLKDLNAALDATVAERTLALTTANAQLASTQKVLESNLKEIQKANQELHNFAYVASHDLKSPLRGIDQLADWIAEDIGDAASTETKKHLQLMQSRVRRMEVLLDDLLAYSRAGKSMEDVVKVDTHQLALDAFELMAPLRQIACHLETKDLPVLQTQKTSLALVLRNLIGNAIKHHHRSESVIKVSAKPIEGGFEFAVTDDGPGIAPIHHQRVFGMFQTLKPRDEIEGSGMGLALVKKTIEARGGSISLESDGAQGCTFRFTWPTLTGTGD